MLTSNEVDGATAENIDYEEPEKNNILCVLWKSNKMAAASYNLSEKLLYVYEEMIDLGPQFMKMRCIYREVNPKFVLSIGRLTDNYIKVLIDCVVTIDEDITVTTDTVRTLPPNFFLLSTNLHEYSYEICKGVLTEMTLASNPDITANNKESYIQSLMNFDYKMSVYAVGCLVKYIEKNWTFFLTSKEDLQYLHIQEKNLSGYVLVDQTSLNAFQLFHPKHHEASFTRGKHNYNREGLSLFKLFSTSCCSKLGQQTVRNLLINPINNLEELNKRLDFINFILTPIFKEFVESLQDNIKLLSDINLIMIKIQNGKATAKDWMVIYKTICHTIIMQELAAPYVQYTSLLSEFHESVTMNLFRLENSIKKAIDFTQMSGRPVIKLGLDENLDAKKLRREDMSKYLNAAARVAAEQLPAYLNECIVTYMPEMGHIIAFKKWSPECNPDVLKPLGFEFMFALQDAMYFKNPLCRDMDQNLGDINADIIDHENRILRRLNGFVLKYNADIRKPLQIIGLMDALMSMGKIAADNNYVRPTLNNENIHEIKKCRDPLMEQVTHFEPNDFYSGGKHSHMKIITGPNGSGKSVYLRQIALAIYLAHVGSYIPAKEANVGMMHSFHTRMQASESATVRLSAFMIDMVQMTQALHNAKENSLILLDEFGRGTTGREGFCILSGVLQQYYNQQESCPHVVVSTHYQSIATYFPQNRLVDHFKMTHTVKDNTFLFLYKLTKGVASSYAFDIANACGLDREVIERAQEIFHCINNNEPIQTINEAGKYDKELMEDMEKFLKEIFYPELDEVEKEKL